MTRPELAILLAYAKNDLSEALDESDLPDDPALDGDLTQYFPTVMAQLSKADLEHHRLRRDIVTNVVVNDLVNRMGIVFVSDLQARTGRSVVDIVRAYRIVRAVFDLDAIWRGVEALDGKVTASVQIELLLSVRHAALDAARWFLASARLTDIESQISQVRPLVDGLSRDLKSLLPPAARSASESRRFGLVHSGIPNTLADQVVVLETLVGALDIVKLEVGQEVAIAETARLYFAAAERLGITRLRAVAVHIAASSPWQRQAFADLMDDLAVALRDIVAAIIRASAKPFAATAALEGWVASDRERLRDLGETVAEVARAAPPDLAMLMVAARRLMSLRDMPQATAVGSP